MINLIALVAALVGLASSCLSLFQSFGAKSISKVARGLARHANNSVEDHITNGHNAYPIQEETKENDSSDS